MRLLRLGVSMQDCEDVLQDIWVRLLQLERVDHIDNAQAYLACTARSVVVTQARRDAVARMVPTPHDEIDCVDESNNPEAAVGARIELARIEERLKEMPERRRGILVARRIEGIPALQVAARFGVSVSMVEKDQLRAVKALEAAVAGEDSQADGAGDARSPAPCLAY